MDSEPMTSPSDAAGQTEALAERARQQARAELDRRANDLGSRARGASDDLRGIAEYLRAQDNDTWADLAERLAAKLSNAGSYLSASDANELLADVETLGRQRPWTAIAGGTAAGLAASRLLKASSTKRYRQGPPSSTAAQAFPVVPPVGEERVNG